MYDRIAHYYDLIHADLEADINWMLTLAQDVGGPILELGCGSGRLLFPLAQTGHQVTGVDNSAAMLASARQRLATESEEVRGRITLVEADMTTLTLREADGRFPLVVIPYNTFLHLDSKQKKATLGRIRRYIAADGRLVIDLINPLAIAQTPNDHLLTLETQFTDPATGDTVLQMASSHLDEKSHILHITWIFDATPPSGGPVHRTNASADYHYLYPHQLELLLQDAGFKMTALAGDYEQSAFIEASDRLLITAVPS